jgi:hypothetical protein
MLGFVHRHPTNPERGNMKAEITIHRAGTNEHVADNTKTLEKHFNRPELGARVGLFIVRDQGFHYNVTTARNYLPCQWSTQSRGNLDN